MRHPVLLVLGAVLGALTLSCNRPLDEHAAEEARTPQSTALSHDVASKVVRPDGKEATHVGEPFATATAVDVATLLANPDAYAGQLVAVEGDVAAMCHHRRAWFALVGDDQSGHHLQVWATPVFLVPDGVIGKRAVAQGTVEVREVSAVQERHIASEHQLEAPEAAPEAASVKKVVLQARGAEFF